MKNKYKQLCIKDVFKISARALEIIELNEKNTLKKTRRNSIFSLNVKMVSKWQTDVVRVNLYRGDNYGS